LANNLIDLRFYVRVGKLGWRFANVPEIIGEHFVHDASFFHRSSNTSIGSGISRGCRRRPSASSDSPLDVRVFMGTTRLRVPSDRPEAVLRRGPGQSQERDV
jgi:hypothetical protein